MQKYKIDLKINWTQKKNTVYLHIDNYIFYLEVPNNFKINNVPSHLKDLCLHYIFYGLDINLKKKNNSKKEYPHFYLNNELIKKKNHDNIGLGYSNGIDSGASLLLLPKKKTIPIFLKRNFEKSKYESNLFNTQGKLSSFNKNAQVGINKINKIIELPDIISIENDFELIRYIFSNKQKPYGWNCSFGHIAIIILLSDFFKIKYICLGGILESKFLGNGYNFNNIINFKNSESEHITAKKILNYVNLDLFYPVGGCSEIITNKIVNNSILKNICSSCVVGDKLYCGQCMKCFRKTKLNNLNFEKIELNKLGIYKKKKEILKIINNYPIKMATSTIYACQKSNYKNLQ